MRKLLELLFLEQIHGFGTVKINRLLNVVEASDSIDMMIRTLSDTVSLPEETLTTARHEAKRKYENLTSQPDLKVITVFDSEYPQGFFSLKDKKPVILYARGDISFLNSPGISVVGTRNPSAWTQRFGMNISKQIGLISGRIIVSGLALGCDRFAHEGALLAGVPTVAVLPSGVNVITPPSHKDLANRIVENGGCLISEYDPDSPATKVSFVRRDSLIAAMTDITFVIECAEKSGTMHTVDAAFQMERHLACYYPDENALKKGAKESDYLGNSKMILEMGAETINRQKDLDKYFTFTLPRSSNHSVAKVE